MVASAVAANGSLHVFRADGQNVTYTWQPSGKTAWNGGQKGKSVAAFTQFAKAPAKITGITADVASNGTLHVFVDCDNGSTYYAFQKKGETAWSGAQKGKTIAGLTLFAS